MHTALTYIPVFNRLCITHYPKLTTLQNKEIAPSTYEASSTGNTELWFLFIGFVLGKTKMILSFAEKLLMLDFNKNKFLSVLALKIGENLKDNDVEKFIQECKDKSILKLLDKKSIIKLANECAIKIEGNIKQNNGKGESTLYVYALRKVIDFDSYVNKHSSCSYIESIPEGQSELKNYYEYLEPTTLLAEDSHSCILQ